MIYLILVFVVGVGGEVPPTLDFACLKSKNISFY